MKNLKRILCLILALCTLFALVSCNNDSQGGTEGSSDADVTTEAPKEDVLYNYADVKYVGDGAEFYAGYSRKDITPTEFPIYMDYGNVSAYKVKSGEELYTTCVALSDGENTVLFITIDVCWINDAQYVQIVDYIKKKVKIPKENIFVSATHDHSTPHADRFDMGLIKWKRIVAECTAEAAKEAVDDLTRTEAYIGTAHSQDLAFVRRYLLEDGTYRGIISGNPSTAREVAHESEADSELQAIYFAREGEKKSILMANWQAHPAHAFSEDQKSISGDFVAYMRSGVESKYDVLFAFYQGAAGNINLSSKIKNITGRYTKVGTALVDVCGEAMSALRRVDLGAIKVNSEAVECEIRKDVFDTELMEAVNLDMNGQYEGNLVKDFGLASENERGALYAAGTYLKKYPKGIMPITVSAISFGDIGFITAPYEMFDTNGMEIKEGSPFEMTFICGYTNGYLGYIASDDAFPHGEYEVYVTRFAMGTAEKIVNALIDMLKEQKG